MTGTATLPDDAAARTSAPARTRVSIAEAIDTVLGAVRPLDAELVPLLDALGRVLAEDVTSPVSLPPWDNAGMDGYAVRSVDVRGASVANVIELPVAAVVAAGSDAPAPLRAGTVVRISTGAPVPAGADGVVRVEDTDAGNETVRITNDRDAGRNVRAAGEDMRRGALALAAGSVLGPAQLGLLAACVQPSVRVHRRPRVAIIGSGDELVAVEDTAEALAGRRIVSSNSTVLHALVRECGGEPVALGIVADTVDALTTRLLDARGCDLVITTAGISMGEFDHTRGAIAAAGGSVEFWRARIRPGGPVGFGHVHGIPWLGLPGNPVSTQVTFELLARPAILRMLGHARVHRQTMDVELADDVTVTASLAHFLRVCLTRDASGTTHAHLTGSQGSGLLTSMALADALLVVPEGRETIPRGERLQAIPLASASATLVPGWRA